MSTKRRTVLSALITLLASSIPARAGWRQNTSEHIDTIEGTSSAIRLYGSLNNVSSANRDSLVSAFPELSSILDAPFLNVGYGDGSGAERSTLAADTALRHLLLAPLDLTALHGVHIAVKSSQSDTRLGEIHAAVATIRRHFPERPHISYRSINDYTMGDRIQVSVLAASLRTS